MTDVFVVCVVAAGPVHIADRAEQDVGQRLVQRTGAVQQLVGHREQQPSLAPKAQRQTCTLPRAVSMAALLPPELSTRPPEPSDHVCTLTSNSFMQSLQSLPRLPGRGGTLTLPFKPHLWDCCSSSVILW